MILHLEREYWPGGTIGTLTIEGFRIGRSIEWPWYRNHPQNSCIPEGLYPLEKAFDASKGWYLRVKNVPGREDISILPATDIKKLKPGNIAPVNRALGECRGIKSKHMFEKLKEILFQAMAQEEVFLELRSSPDKALNLAQYQRKVAWIS
ncbi:hypothetical protein IFO69_10490 [Echinicola sp. CAU 1574]|uniref:DUF5675 domain-containing protein n=1 Tax=Echinicola arenosa TaxID=2774144 RepID=A0ABR9AK53_9BACT|nr:DUF5675 family protein [Echinicola arenosa]MBD8489173.1 hypothetical protein [Echinicola arenosa]